MTTCKDCVHYAKCLANCNIHHNSRLTLDAVEPEHFCSYGTPKERGGEK